jgi:guanylate kinase
MSPAPRKRGLLVIVSGPAGVGKTTVCDRLIAQPGFVRSISVTTRAPRKGEKDGRDYQFWNRDAFERAVKAGEFLEHAKVHNSDYYGTLEGPVRAALDEGRSVVLNIDVQGAAQIRAKGLPVISFFLMPPSLDELRRRITKRGDTSPEAIERRFRTAQVELSRAKEYDHQIVNDDLERTVSEIQALLAKARETAEG